MDSTFIEIDHLYKSFNTENGKTDVLKDVNLQIEKGDIYGIMGFSGAGKSTLVRCMNRLEEPDSGSITIDGIDILSLNQQDLNKERRKIGMIFQSFNLFESKTVYENIEYPLLDTVKSKEDRRRRVLELAELVQLTDKIQNYPAQLSGGQKQRVGISRALANNPSVLLCDEATSALDLQTTLNVLDLLKEINKNLGVTIILITHEIEVIKYACNNVAIIEDGRVMEHGETIDILNAPQSRTGKIFINVQNDLDIAWAKKEDERI